MQLWMIFTWCSIVTWDDRSRSRNNEWTRYYWWVFQRIPCKMLLSNEYEYSKSFLRVIVTISRFNQNAKIFTKLYPYKETFSSITSNKKIFVVLCFLILQITVVVCRISFSFSCANSTKQTFKWLMEQYNWLKGKW